MVATKLLPIQLDESQITGFCRRWGVQELAIFGSAVNGSLRADSDLDLLVTFIPEARPTLITLGDMQRQLSQIFHRPVDLIERGGIEESRNPFIKKSILTSARTIYAR